MADERLSKLQKWILTTCYKVTVLLDNEDLTPIDGKHTYSDPCCNCKVNGYHHNRDNKDNDFDGKIYITVKKDRYDCISNECNRKKIIHVAITHYIKKIFYYPISIWKKVKNGLSVGNSILLILLNIEKLM